MLPDRNILRGAADMSPGWKRELCEWLLALAAMIGGVWISRAVGQFIYHVIIQLPGMS